MAIDDKKSGALNMKTMDKVCVGVAELIGTGFLVFVGCMGCMGSLVPGGVIPHEQISFAFGFAVMFVIQCFGHISGAHLNPAVTLTAVILGDLHYLLAPIYVVAQLVGAVLGFSILKAVTPSAYFDAKEHFDHTLNMTVKDIGVCSTVPNANISSLQALVVEIIITLILVLVCCGSWDHRNKNNSDSVAIKFGLTIAGLAMAAGPYSGASMNPARSLGPAIINNDWQQHWIYWVGPLLAAAFGASGYKVLFSRPPPESESNDPENIPLSTRHTEK